MCWQQLTTKGDWINLIIFSQGPQEETTQVHRVNELSSGGSSAPHHHRCVVPYHTYKYTSGTLHRKSPAAEDS